MAGRWKEEAERCLCPRTHCHTTARRYMCCGHFLKAERALQEVYGDGVAQTAEVESVASPTARRLHFDCDPPLEEGEEVSVERGMLYYRLTVLLEVLRSSMVASKTFPVDHQSGNLPQHTVGGRTAARKGAAAEYAALYRDVLDLAAPDFEISGHRKLQTISRIRTSYQGLIASR